MPSELTAPPNNYHFPCTRPSGTPASASSRPCRSSAPASTTNSLGQRRFNRFLRTQRLVGSSNTHCARWPTQQRLIFCLFLPALLLCECTHARTSGGLVMCCWLFLRADATVDSLLNNRCMHGAGSGTILFRRRHGVAIQVYGRDLGAGCRRRRGCARGAGQGVHVCARAVHVFVVVGVA